MATHDPRRVLESLRDHLTQPETNVAFLLGAGTSCSVQVEISPEEGSEKSGSLTTRPLIPNVAALTAICEKEIRKLDPEGEAKRFGLAFDAIERETRPIARQTSKTFFRAFGASFKPLGTPIPFPDSANPI